MQYSKKWFIKTFGWPDVVNSSVKNMCIRFVTLTRIAKKECVCQTLQRSLRYLRVNSIQVAYDHASFVDVRGTLEQTVGGGFNLHFAIAAGIWKKKNGCPSEENLFGHSTLLMIVTHIVFP